MNLKTATPETLADLYLPDEALAALAAGEEWEYTPDSTEGVDADVSYCDDCDTYHLTWDVWGLRLDADGTLYETWTAVDSDGDWSFVDEYPYGEFDHGEERAAVRERGGGSTPSTSSERGSTPWASSRLPLSRGRPRPTRSSSHPPSWGRR